MLYLTNSSIRYAVDICSEKPNYRVIIVADDEMEQDVVTRMVLSIASPNMQRIQKNLSRYTIEFNNGSIIKTVQAKETARGLKSHLLIVDKAIKDEIINNIFGSCEILEQVDRWKSKNNINE